MRMALTPDEATAALEALIGGINPLTSDPLKFIDGMEAILADTLTEDFGLTPKESEVVRGLGFDTAPDGEVGDVTT
jgi:hypothetical protein